MAQLFALAASVTSLALAGIGGKGENVISSSRRSLIPSSFSIGLVSGASLTICLMHQIEKFRIKERIRLYYRDVLLRMEEGEDNESINEEKKNRNFPQSYSYGESSKVQVLVSSTNMITSNLCCAKVTLKPRTGITQRRSEAVECYYVLSGRGLFIQECDDESNKCFESDMARDEVMVVEPWKLRSIYNKHMEDLVFLRISDSMIGYDGEHSEIVTMQLENMNTVQLLADAASGFRSSISKLGEMIVGRKPSQE